MSLKAHTTDLPSDTVLVAAALRGEHGAFVEIVKRHQALVCAVAYQVTGDFAASEDVAQETFVTAWKKLAELREPSKLKAWLSRLALTLATDWLRKNGSRRRGQDTGPVVSGEAVEGSLSPDAAAVSQEEAAMVWQALESLPESARLPMILFYREGQSISAVAATLDLSEDAVKQRLSRGREALRDRLANVMQEVLYRTQPGAIFAFAVMASIGALAAPAAVAATAFAAGTAVSLSTATASTASAGSNIVTTALMSATKLSIAASIAFLLPAVWPLSDSGASSGPESPLAVPTAIFTQDKSGSALAAPPSVRTKADPSVDPRIHQLAAMLDALRRESTRGLEAVMLDLECRHLILQLPAELLPHALDLIAARRVADVANPMAGILFARWAALDPRGAYAAALDIRPGPGDALEGPPRLQYECLSGLTHEWTRLDREAALTFFEQMPDDQRSNAMMAYGHEIAQLNPPEALGWWKSADRKPRPYSSVLESLIRWGRTDEQAAWQWVLAQPEDSIPDFKPADFLYQLSYSNASAALTCSRDLPKGERRTGIVWNVFDRLASQDPAAAVEALFTLTPDDLVGSSLADIAQQVAHADPITLADALPRWTDPAQRDRMTALVCPALAKKDRARAEALAATITDVTLRQDTQNKLNPARKK